MKKRILILFLSAVLAVVPFSGCKTETTGPISGTEDTTPEVFDEEAMFATPRTLTIYVMDRGYHYEWLEEIADKYEEKFNNVTVKVEGRSMIETDVENTLPLGPEQNDVDLYFSSMPNFSKYYAEQSGSKWGEYSVLENLTKLYNTKVYGEDVTIREKMNENVTEAMTIKTANGDAQYALSWAAGACGLLYNTELFEECGLTVPETTDDLIALLADVKQYNIQNPSKKVTPFVWSETYWNYLINVWWTQYSGIESVWNFFRCTTNGNVMTPQLEALTEQEGKLEAYKVLEALLSNVDDSSGGGTLTNKSAQAIFTNPSKRVLMCPEGDSFETETAANGQDGSMFEIMPTPKLSAAVEKYGSIDAVPSYTYTLASTHGVFMPCYSEEKDIAKHFLTYFYSDEAATIFTRVTGSFQAFKTEYIQEYIQNSGLQDTMTNFRASQYEVMTSSDLTFFMNLLSPLRYGQAALEEFPVGITPASAFYTKQYTAQSYYNAEVAYYTDNWSTMLRLSGIQ